MPKSTFNPAFFTVLCPVLAFAETDSLPASYLSLGPKKVGICFGDAPVYTGFKFGLINDDILKMNGVDISLLNLGSNKATSVETNGISIGVVVNSMSRNNGISFAGIWNDVGQENGMMLSPINVAQKVNGIVLGAVLVCDTLNGLVVTYTLQSRKIDNDSLQNRVTGMVICPAFTNVNELRGVAIGGYNSSYQHKGLAIGLVNCSRCLKGVQVGLYNVAMNNPKGLRRLPLINMHFGK